MSNAIAAEFVSCAIRTLISARRASRPGSRLTDRRLQRLQGAPRSSGYLQGTPMPVSPCSGVDSPMGSIASFMTEVYPGGSAPRTSRGILSDARVSHDGSASVVFYRAGVDRRAPCVHGEQRHMGCGCVSWSSGIAGSRHRGHRSVS
jgi:hypothetical protein